MGLDRTGQDRVGWRVQDGTGWMGRDGMGWDRWNRAGQGWMGWDWMGWVGQDRMGWGWTGWDGQDRMDGIRLNRMGGMGQDRTGWTGQGRMGQDETGLDGMGQDETGRLVLSPQVRGWLLPTVPGRSRLCSTSHRLSLFLSLPRTPARHGPADVCRRQRLRGAL